MIDPHNQPPQPDPSPEVTSLRAWAAEHPQSEAAERFALGSNQPTEGGVVAGLEDPVADVHPLDAARYDRLFGRSNLGTPTAREQASRVPDEVIERIKQQLEEAGLGTLSDDEADLSRRPPKDQQ